jgi:S1-C subfamily serine protease
MTQEFTTPEGSPVAEPTAVAPPPEDQHSALSTLTDEGTAEIVGAKAAPPPVEPTHEMPASPSEPPSPAAPTPPPPPLPKPRSGGIPGWLAALMALLLVVASSGITYLITADRSLDLPSDEVGANRDPGNAESPELVPDEEPVAAAAAVILPSVVQIQTDAGVGSGVIYDSDGLILTAAHVVSGAETVIVRLNDGEEVEGTVLGGTSGADVAVVQVDRSGLPAAELALDEDPQVGQMAIAVGSPWGLQGTVTAGIISAVDQSIPSGGTARAVLQTDAAINPGNSGGPLVDRDGRVLGINVSIFSLSGANDGVGFAVPIDVANGIAERVVSGDSIVGAFLGVTGDNPVSGQAGAVIVEVTPESAAAEAGIEPGDLVISVDGVGIQGMIDLAAQVQTHSPGDTVDLVIVRDGQEQTLSVTFGERPDDLG